MITIEDVAYLRVPVDDLEAQERFLLDFGMQRAGRTDRALYMRGAGTQPVIHISELRTDEYRPTIGLVAASLADLEKVAQTFGTAVEQNAEPGGGKIVRGTDPFGFKVEIVHRPPAEFLSVRPIKPSNFGVERSGYGRFNAKQHFERGPSHVLRLGHVVLIVPSCNQAFDWYSQHFNFKISDSYHAPNDTSRFMVVFARCGLGQRFTDHHTLAFIDSSAFKELPERGFEHSAYEVLDWDDVAVGHDFLLSAGYNTHTFGIGRHVAGGMVFDYWRDTAGNKVEHWADGDHVNDDYERWHVPAGAVPFKSWGPEPSADFFVQPPAPSTTHPAR
jgi:catechol 2,3-dioxygenase-like lactoylglutathione lyase family enzyme